MNDPKSHQLQLIDGRTLSYSDTGTGKNGTWIHCHGIPGSRHELAHLTEELITGGIRVIVPDRPGYGDSTPHPDYTFEHHSADLHQLAEHLGLERFAVSGFSGGGVFAMATAHDLRERVEQITIAATPAVPLMSNPFDYASELTANAWRAAIENPGALASELETLTTSVEVLSETLISAIGPNEYENLSSEYFRHAFHLSARTALQQGPGISAAALARDSRLIAEQWPFHPEDLGMPITIIHGRNDELVLTEHQSALISHLPNAKQLLLDDAGHYSTIRFIFNS